MATWKRSWKYYDIKMSSWSDKKTRKKIKKIISNNKVYRLKKYSFDRTYAGELDTWDYQWSFARLNEGGLSVVPAVNLIKNIGFGDDATHTTQKNFQGLPLYRLEPPFMEADIIADEEFDDRLFKIENKADNLFSLFSSKIKKWIT